MYGGGMATDGWLLLSMIPPFFFNFFITVKTYQKILLLGWNTLKSPSPGVLTKLWGFRVSSLGRNLKKIFKENTWLVLCRGRRPLMHISSLFYTKLRVFALSILARISSSRAHLRSDSSKLDCQSDTTTVWNKHQNLSIIPYNVDK